MGLLHMSINAGDPQNVAVFLSRILGGRCFPFPPFPDCWITFTEADDGSAVEVYPLTHTLRAGKDRIACEIGEPADGPSCVHAAIRTPLHRNEVIELAGREGWMARICDRGPFECVEVWLENRLLVEVLDPLMQEDYRRGMTAENWVRMFALE